MPETDKDQRKQGGGRNTGCCQTRKELPVGMGEVQGGAVFDTYPLGAEKTEKSIIEACL